MVKQGNYAPAKGDIVYLQFNPQQGREQAGTRPAVILSPKEYNAKVGLALACPITSHAKGYPFEVALPDSLKTKGVILSDHIKNLDWKARHAAFVETIPSATLEEVFEKIGLLLG
jgi:mRNA interferase MazF